MKHGIPGLALVAGLLAASPAASLEEDNGPWSGSLRFGYIAVGGNTESETINARTRVNYDRDRWHHTLTASAVGSSQDDETTAEAYRGTFNSQWDLTPVFFVFGELDYIKDKFSGFDQQFSQVAGVGWRALRSERQRLDFSLGAGARQARLRDGGRENEAVGNAGFEYRLELSETTSFNQTGNAVAGSDNTRLESVTELRAGIIGNLGLVLGYTLTRNTSPPPDSRNTDTLLTVSLDYEF